MNNPEIILLPAELPELHEKISELVLEEKGLEYLVAGWCNDAAQKETRQSLMFSRFPDLSFAALGITFLKGKKTVFNVAYPKSKIIEILPNYQDLDESVSFFADKEGYLTNDAWFNERNTRLGIYIDEEISRMISPARGISELVTSYALSSKGYAEITYLNSGQDSGFNLELVFMGEETDESPGWTESIFIFEAELKEATRKGARILKIL